MHSLPWEEDNEPFIALVRQDLSDARFLLDDQGWILPAQIGTPLFLESLIAKLQAYITAAFMGPGLFPPNSVFGVSQELADLSFETP
jgi:hypothetical protein